MSKYSENEAELERLAAGVQLDTDDAREALKTLRQHLKTAEGIIASSCEVVLFQRESLDLLVSKLCTCAIIAGIATVAAIHCGFTHY